MCSLFALHPSIPDGYLISFSVHALLHSEECEHRRRVKWPITSPANLHFNPFPNTSRCHTLTQRLLAAYCISLRIQLTSSATHSSIPSGQRLVIVVVSHSAFGSRHDSGSVIPSTAPPCLPNIVNLASNFLIPMPVLCVVPLPEKSAKCMRARRIVYVPGATSDLWLD